jgi:uncharacterized protein YrrD
LILAGHLRGLPVVDAAAAAKLGHVADLVLDPRRHRVAAVVVRGGPGPPGRGAVWLAPGENVIAVGADALTVRGAAPLGASPFELTPYPTRSGLRGRLVLGWGGRLLGRVADVLLDAGTGAVTGYALAVRAHGLAAPLLGRPGRPLVDYVRAGAEVRVGPQLIVAPERVLVRGEPAEALGDAEGVGAGDAPGWRPAAV